MSEPSDTGSDTWNSVRVRDTVPGVNVSQALISNSSQARATNIYARNVLASAPAVPAEGPASNQANGSTIPAVSASLSLFSLAQAALPALGRLFSFENPLTSGDTLPLEVLALRNQQRADPPQEYVIRYYVLGQHGSTASAALQAQASSNGVSPQPVNGTMQESIGQALATISAQLPGRFRFVPTTNPEEADISFAAVSGDVGFAGQADFHTGTILLKSMYFDSNMSPDRSVGISFVLHEIGHALGLRHPFSRESRVATDDASFLDTVMTYDVNNHARGRDGAGMRYPVSLMGSDLQALAMLYPIAADRQAAGTIRVGRHPQMQYSSANGSIRVQGQGIEAGQAGFITEGLNLQIMPNTQYDVVQFSTPIPEIITPRSSSSPQPAQGESSSNRTPAPQSAASHTRSSIGNQVSLDGVSPSPSTTARIVTSRSVTRRLQQLEQVGSGMILTQDYGPGATYIPVTPEQINLSPGSENVTVRDNIRIHVVPNFYDSDQSLAAWDRIALHGNNNRISLPGEDMGVSLELKAGTTNHVIIRNSEQLAHFPYLNITDGESNASAVWHKDAQGQYHMTVTPERGRQTILTIELQPSTPLAHERFESMLRYRSISMDYRDQPNAQPRSVDIPLRSTIEAIEESRRQHPIVSGNLEAFRPPMDPSYTPQANAHGLREMLTGRYDLNSPPSQDTRISTTGRFIYEQAERNTEPNGNRDLPIPTTLPARGRAPGD